MRRLQCAISSTWRSEVRKRIMDLLLAASRPPVGSKTSWNRLRAEQVFRNFPLQKHSQPRYVLIKLAASPGCRFYGNGVLGGAWQTTWDSAKPCRLWRCSFRSGRAAKGGIKAQSKRGAFGESWWAKRWSEVLSGFDLGARLTRGRSYARSGQVLAVEIGVGAISAKVQGSRSKPYTVTIRVKTLSPAEWSTVATVLSHELPCSRGKCRRPWRTFSQRPRCCFSLPLRRLDDGVLLSGLVKSLQTYRRRLFSCGRSVRPKGLSGIAQRSCSTLDTATNRLMPQKNEPPRLAAGAHFYFAGSVKPLRELCKQPAASASQSPRQLRTARRCTSCHRECPGNHSGSCDSSSRTGSDRCHFSRRT